MRTSAYLLRQLSQMKLVHTGLETPLFSHYFLSVCPLISCFLQFFPFFLSFFLLTSSYFDSPFPYLSYLLLLPPPDDTRKKKTH